jgi:nucleoside phosphorylase
MVDIATLLSAVKPRERADQYVVLSALFALNAHIKSVTAGQITKLLKLHLGAKIPSNVNASLRAYSAYVTPTDEGPPILWSLTSKGIDRLRSLSGLALSTASDAAIFNSDIGIVCALEDPELAAVQRALGGAEVWKEVGDARHAHVYRETDLLREGGGTKLRVVATTAASMGLTSAAIATTQLVFQFRPRLVAMIGIAAGTRSGGKQFGDVLVADPSVDYNSGKVVFEGGIRGFQPDPYPIGLNPRLRTILHKYRGSHPLFAEIRQRWNGAVPSAPNRLHVGPVGAADQVIDDPTRVLEIQKNWRKLIGVEMETYGVYRAVYEAPEPKPRAVSFKAVCDFAAEKSDSWQEYAAFMAAEFAVEFFKREWAALWPTNLTINLEEVL